MASESKGFSGTQMECNFMFGLKGDVSKNVEYLDEHVVVYPCGHNLVHFNTETRVQQFVPGSPHSHGITAMATTASKRFTAYAESGDRPSITVFEWHSFKRKKFIPNLDVGSSQFTHLAFTHDGRNLLVQGGAPEWTLVYLNWEKAKVVASVKASNAQGSEIHQVEPNPTDSSVVAVVADGLLRLYKVQDNTFKTIPLSFKRDPQNYLCMSWLPDDRMVVATDTGELLLFEANEFRTVLITSPSDGNSIDSIIPFSKGFLVGCNDSVLRVYERSDDRDFYKNPKKFKVCDDSSRVMSVAVTPSEDYLACTLDNHQAYQLAFSNSEMLRVEEMKFDPLCTPFHGPGSNGSCHITGLDSCIRKPLIVTTGLDRTVRVWNYQTRTQELSREFAEEAYSVAMHPSGVHILVGFSDKLRLMNLLMNDIRAYKEFPIKACRECKFSNGGQYFAAVNGTAIFVYQAYTCEPMTSLRGHNGKVRSLSWSSDDRFLVSCGADGAVFRWDMRAKAEKSQAVVSESNLSCVACSEDAVLVHVVGEGVDRAPPAFHVMDLNDSAPTGNKPRETVDTNGITFGQVCISSSGRMLFAGTSDVGRLGTIRSYLAPLAPSRDYLDYTCHSAPITRMALSFDDSLLFTASEDGSVCVFSTISPEARRTKRDKEPTAAQSVMMAEEILVTKSDLEEKAVLMSELKAKVEELRKHNNYQLRARDLSYKEKITQVEEKFQQELSADQAQHQSLVEEKADMEMEYDDKIAKLERKHVTELEELEATYKAKITAEIERYEALVKEREAMNESWDEANAQMVETHEKHVAELKAEYSRKLEEEEASRARLEQEKWDLEAQIDRETNAIEEDADMEIEELKAKYDARLAQEKKSTLMLKGENGIMRKKFGALTSDIATYKEEIKGLADKEKDLYEQIRGLEKDIQGHKKEIREREETISDKEKRIYDLRKKNQELEKFKFVLNYKIQELKRQIMPRKKEIADMREQIKEMELELLQYHKSNAALDLMISELKLKKEGMQKEIEQLEAQLASGDSVIRRFRDDLHDSVQYIGDYKHLKTLITNLYRQYVHEGVASGGSGEADMQKEYSRQREYLEKSVESLKRKLAKDSDMHRNDKARLMRENTQLTKEINMLRRELKSAKVVQTATQLGFTMDKDGTLQLTQSNPGRKRSQPTVSLVPTAPTEGTIPIRAGSTRASSSLRSALEAADGSGLSSAERREIDMQRQQIQQLREHLTRLREAIGLNPGLADALNQTGSSRPMSRERLEPLGAGAGAGVSQ